MWEFRVAAKQDIFWFEVTVDNVLGVQELQSNQDLVDEEACCAFRESSLQANDKNEVIHFEAWFVLKSVPVFFSTGCCRTLGDCKIISNISPRSFSITTNILS